MNSTVTDYSYLDELMKKIRVTLRTVQKNKAVEFLGAYHDAFSKSTHDLSHTVKHIVDTGSSRFIKQQTYLLIIDENVKEMLHYDVFEHSKSSLVSNVILVFLNQMIRFCIDYRWTNNITS